MDASITRLAEAISARYRVENKLGGGGMADVYLARDLPNDRDVAIKVLRPELAEALGVERFLREIRLLARLQHPHILSLVDSGQAADLVYYVMPYLPGGSLRARLERERELPVAAAVQVLREVGGALEYAHEQGVVHRDIKPENVLFSAGHAQVADFGIARIAAGTGNATALTTMGVTVGTPQYMAPEQAAGDPRLDHRADLYAFGVLAYELLAGAPPFVAGSAAQLLAMHLSEAPIPLSKRRPSVPAPLADLVMRCLEKRPADRWQNTRELLAALERAGSGDVTTSGSRRIGTELLRFPITESVARGLDRRSFDPRMLGTSIEYLDNHTESDVLVALYNAIWLDGSDFEPHLRALPYRCLAPTYLGFEPVARHRFPLRLADHVHLQRELLFAKADECRPSLVIVVGFSASGDMVLKMAAGTPEGARAIDGVIALGPNQSLETCFISREMAKLEGGEPARVLTTLRTISETATNLDEWMLLNGYLGRMMARFHSDVSPLSVLGQDIVEPFARDGAAAFAPMYRDATVRSRNVRCVFEDTEVCNRLLREVLTQHMDQGVLGDRHRDGALRIQAVLSHFDLLNVDCIAGNLASMVEELRRMPE
jgi:serine/threonine protein kinase